MITRAARLPAIAFDLQGHRGARGLAPENTIESFSTALAIGVTTLELDVGTVRQGQVPHAQGGNFGDPSSGVIQ